MVPGKHLVDFWFDPSCPYTWITSRWLLEAARVRPIEIRWNVMSLSVLNEHRDDDPEGDPEGYLWLPARLCAAVQQEHGHAALGRLYTAMGTRFIVRAEESGFEPALDDAGLPTELAGAAWSPEYDGPLRASHQAGVDLVGEGVGTPILALPPTEDGRRPAFFGPVISPAPQGERAGRLWDGLLLLAGVPGFFELKRTLTGEPDFGGAS
ncbi:disulfide bond formation protein DsbA [Actinomadura craniellae]|uniref:Disulfide bond formation protein DsbA n=1 Tax=Actinomadura craniellae TaxID=2231787 RepID=A0A365HAH0_9ACTN|nr:DsbA family protein [Actinomadura craniellae]RAY16081.1 disulfide bond formation protein DsbA [Actinomadura craniellae]